MTNNKPLSLSVAVLLKIGQKHKAAAHFSLTSLVGEMEREFDRGELKLNCGVDGLKYSYFPNGAANDIILELFNYKLIPDYVLDDVGGAQYSPFDTSKVQELNRELQKLVKDTECDTKSIIQASDICDKEDAKLINDVVAASAKDILHCRQRDDVENKVKNIIYDLLCVNMSSIKMSSRVVEDLGADSLDATEMLMAVEEEFEISVPDEDAEKIKTVGDIVDYLVDEKRQDEHDNILAAVSNQDENAKKDVEETLTKDITEYVASNGGMNVSDIAGWLDGADEWNSTRVRNFIEKNCPQLSIREDFVYLNEVREAKSQKELSTELIMKYLKNKGGRATLKQIQSRFKGYLNNTCREIKDLVSRETNCIVVFSGKQSQCEVVLSETWNESV